MIHYYIGDSAPAPGLAQGVSVSCEVGVCHQPEDCLVLLEGHRGMSVVIHRAGYIRPDSDILPDRSRTVTYQILMF